RLSRGRGAERQRCARHRRSDARAFGLAGDGHRDARDERHGARESAAFVAARIASAVRDRLRRFGCGRRALDRAPGERAPQAVHDGHAGAGRARSVGRGASRAVTRRHALLASLAVVAILAAAAPPPPPEAPLVTPEHYAQSIAALGWPGATRAFQVGAGCQLSGGDAAVSWRLVAARGPVRTSPVYFERDGAPIAHWW